QQARDLLVRETLRVVAASTDSVRLADIAARFDTPLFLYANGVLVAASDPIFEELAPIGRLLPAAAARVLNEGDEITTSSEELVGATTMRFGFRATPDSANTRFVLAAPARTDNFALDRRRRDLGIFVLFAIAVGALAALWLSGLAARQVAQEIKNPLTPMRLGMQHLRRARRDPRVNFDRVLDENVTRVLAEIDRLDEIARAFSRYGTAPEERAHA